MDMVIRTIEQAALVVQPDADERGLLPKARAFPGLHDSKPLKKGCNQI